MGSIGADIIVFINPAIPPEIKNSEMVWVSRLFYFRNCPFTFSFIAKIMELQSPNPRSGNKDPFHNVLTPSFFMISFNVEIKVP